MNIRTLELKSTAADGTPLISYVALPATATADNPVCGILVAPEWWGMVEHPKAVTERLASLGFAAVAMDVYGDGKLTTDAAKAGEWMTAALADQDALMARCGVILADFANLPEVDSTKLGVVGYCFGGKIALDMARTGLPVKAVATFHGNPSPIRPATDEFAAKVLFAHGGADSMVSLAAVDGLRAELDAVGADYVIDIYDNAKHGFSNPAADQRAIDNGVDLGYNEAAATASWDKMVDFMKQNLA
ncbi:MAG: dienelactone hydrolase family protein [Moraxella sp.]|nr:dienelactone hydrolase family protein [Moraxella sp.]